MMLVVVLHCRAPTVYELIVYYSVDVSSMDCRFSMSTVYAGRFSLCTLGNIVIGWE